MYSHHGYLRKVQDAVRGSTGAARDIYRRIERVDARGNVVTEWLGNGVTRRHWQDGRTGRARGITSTKTTTGDVQELSYTWDVVGNLTQRIDSRAAGT